MNQSPHRTSITLLAAAVLLASGGRAAAQNPDAPGAKDHPLVKRYTGSTLVAHDARDYDAMDLVVSAKGPKGQVESRPIEGKATRLIYVGPEGRSSLEVFRNYQAAFREAGFETLFTCSGKECGHAYGLAVYPSGRRLQTTKHGRGALSTNVGDPHYLAARRVGKDGATYVALFVAFHNARKDPNVLLEIVETKEMDRGMVTVNADAMAEGIRSDGKIALYGIYFDTGSATIKPESQQTMQEIAKLLGQEPSLRLLVVGHTDNQGGYEHNLKLSERRASAVVGALVSQHGIQSSRLRAAGVGYLAPVASNDSDDGRAKNRRVELVKQ
jgi:OmpA-OmpF porin, OOP family